MNIQRGMVGLRIEGHGSRRAFDLHAGFNRCQHLFTIKRTRFLDAFRPQLDALILRYGDFVNDLGIAEALVPFGQKILVGRGRIFLAVIAGD